MGWGEWMRVNVCRNDRLEFVGAMERRQRRGGFWTAAGRFPSAVCGSGATSSGSEREVEIQIVGPAPMKLPMQENDCKRV